MLISDDGEWSHRVTSPRLECPKGYRVSLAEAIGPDVARRFTEGVLLKGEEKMTRPAQLEIISPCEAVLTIHEGKYPADVFNFHGGNYDQTAKFWVAENDLLLKYEWQQGDVFWEVMLTETSTQVDT